MSLTRSSSTGSRAPGDPDEAVEGSLQVTPELVAVALVAIVIGVVARFVADTPLWLDEALSANIAGLPLDQIPEALRHDGHPPLYYVLLHFWMDVAGTGDAAVRALSGVFSALTLPLVWVAARRRGGRVLGLVAVALVAVAPYATRYATETRMYALVMLLVTAGYLLLDDVVREGRGGWWRWGAIMLVTAALLYSHYWSMWLLGAVGLVLVWLSLRATDASTKAQARKAIGAVVVGGVLFVPWLPAMLYQAEHTGTPWAGPQRPFSILAVTLADFGGGGFRDAELVGTLLAMLFAIGLFGAAASRFVVELDVRTRPRLRVEAGVVALTLAIGCVVGYLTASAYASRYAAVVFPLFLLVVAGGVVCFAHRWVRFGVLAAMLLASSMGVLFGATQDRTQARQIATAIDERAAPGDLVVYCPDQLGPAGSRAVSADVEEVVFPTLAPPQRVDWVDYAERNAQADPAAIAAEVLTLAGPNSAIFVVWNGEYQTLEGKCEALVDTLAAARPGSEVLVPASNDFFEFATLVYLPPAP